MQKYQAQRRLSRQRSIEAFRLSSTNLSEAESSIHTSLSRPHTRSSHLRPPPLKPISSLSLNSELEASDDALGAAELPTPLTSFDRQGIPHHGPITKSDIPDVLYFARYAELVYNHQEAKAIAPILLIHFNEANNLFKSPYMIIFDHEWQCVVIAIRGTYSITDILVDMHFAEAPLDIPELPEGKHGCHPGMLRTSLNILEDITKEDRLRKILLDPDSEYSHYNLVVTGHSLGAGIAALLCYMLRKEGFSNAKCYSYCPPGQLLTREVAEHFAQFCISVVNGDDLVPRTTRNSLELLKRDIEELLADCELAKWQLFKSVLGNYCCGSRTRSNKVELDPEAVPDNLRARDSSLDKLDKLDMSVFPTKPKLRVGTITMDVDGAEAHVPITLMFMAGRILYIEKLPVDLSISSDNINENATLKKQLSFNEIRPTNKSHRHSVLAVFRPDWTKPQDPIPAGDSSHLPQSSPSTPQSSASAISGTAFRYKYVPRWAEREEFCEIILSKSMLTDHSPFAVIKDFWKMSEGQILQTLRK
ncbi:Alpha/Beta hydrolase protein [Polychytrium aggregatum]|uniref:Alpha/Beta hydrolase protein n=1 Tax=Polychytrium aggregatum TaxID=110093 RepID=UPI0022FF0C7E|nr:Alpha/Beta hydrolase protein [Polychytrium aggregatum]KAI9203524.1 Alpha/Beta hydrolase protein [Polychytrium aggregatum]